MEVHLAMFWHQHGPFVVWTMPQPEQCASYEAHAVYEGILIATFVVKDIGQPPGFLG